MSDEPQQPPRRDKFAAMAQQQQQPQPQQQQPPPKRDKLAAMSARQQAPANDKLSAMAKSSTETTAVAMKKDAHDTKVQQLQQRLQQRQAVWNDLAIAEAETVRLLEYARENARETSQQLAHACTNTNIIGSDTTASRISQLGQEYASTLERIQARLQPHAQLVQAYRSRDANVQHAVQLRMAQERRALLQEWTRLEQEELTIETTAVEATTTTTGDKKKRKRY